MASLRNRYDSGDSLAPEEAQLADQTAALLTGRYSCRTGVWHTMGGRSLLRQEVLHHGHLAYLPAVWLEYPYLHLYAT